MLPALPLILLLQWRTFWPADAWSTARGEALPECRGLRRRVLVRIGLGDETSPPVDVDVTDGGGGGDGGGDAGGLPPCRVMWLSHEEASSPGILDAALGAFDAVLSDSFAAAAPFGARRRGGHVHFLERVGQLRLTEDPDVNFLNKRRLLSVLLPARDSEAWADPGVARVAEQALELMPEHTFFDDDGEAEGGGAADGGAGGAKVGGGRAAAFGEYRFALIAAEEAHTVSDALVQCLGSQTVPLFNGFVGMGNLLLRGIVPFNASFFSLELVRSTLQDINHDIGWLWNYHRLVLDPLSYRYSRPFEERLASIACTHCRASVPPPPPAPEAAPLAFVGVYSAKANFERRMAVRETWGRLLTEGYGLTVRFFLGEISDEPSLEDERARWEATVYGDIVELGISEGYEMNSAKGLRFHEWCAKNVLAEFLVKVDDDIYLRPGPLVEILRRRQPAGFVWGYFDFMSPVPREEGVPFYNSEETYPFQVFPPYPRGLVRALSMDVVRHLARLSRRGRLRLISGDDPCLGVHLRQAIKDEEDPIPMLTIDDRDSYRAFAMEPSCNPRLWSHVTDRSWVVHHVTAKQMLCMWEADVSEGYYLLDERGNVALGGEAALGAEMTAELALAPLGRATAPPPMPTQRLCECLREGPLAEALESRTDKVNASSTYRIWGDPNFDGD